MMLVIKGSKEECKKISADLVKRYGNITIQELCKKLNREDVILC